MPAGITAAVTPAPTARKYGDAAAAANGAPPNAGAAGTLCHVECANRGLCNRATGACACFQGYAGANCASRVTYYGALA